MKAKMIHCLYAALCLSVNATAQISENFTDGNYTANPVWIDAGNNFIVNTDFKLQSNNMVSGSTSFISTPNSLATMTEWELLVKLNFNPSSVNYADVFLTASASDLTGMATNGYFVRLGGTTDEISLYRKDGATSVKIIDGLDGVLNNSSNQIKLKVTRDAANNFTLFRDITGAGTNYYAEGSISDAVYTGSAFFGILIKQSTAAFFQQHFFDDITVKTFVPDVTPPAVITATAIDAKHVDVLFNEPVTQSSVLTLSNYLAGNGIGVPVSATIDALNAALVHLVFATDFPNGISCNISINGITDYAGNVLNNATASFSYYRAQQYDIVIDEVMADPNPPVSLPSVEWIEIKNCSTQPVNLQGWKISDGSATEGLLPYVIIQPDSFLILCSSSSAASLSVYGQTLAVSNFPSLNDDKDQLLLSNETGTIIHALNYSNAWYKNELKKNGGWSLEMIDTKTPCAGISNWEASAGINGGTPAAKNSADDVNADIRSPRLVNAYPSDSVHIVLVFDEPMEMSSAVLPDNYQISDGIGIPVSVQADAPFFNKVTVALNTTLQKNKVYTISVSGLTDCAGNGIGSKKSAKVGMSDVAVSGDIVINEILFNPPANGTDYVEIYNRSKKTVNLKQLFIANRNSAGVISSIVPFSMEDFLLFPQEFIVITEDAGFVKKSFITKIQDAVVEVSTMPSYNDDRGDVIILNAAGEIIDEVAYQDDWHFELINNTEGVALERINSFAASQSKDNWHSASSGTGFGTPTYKNSQSNEANSFPGEIVIRPDILSPDNDGVDDYASISYQFTEPGYVISITIYDAAGRLVRSVQQNSLCGTRGSFKWDGLGDKNKLLAAGIYIVFTEVFNTKGTKKQFKHVLVVAGKS